MDQYQEVIKVYSGVCMQVAAEATTLQWLLAALGFVLFVSDGWLHVLMLFQCPGFIVYIMARLTCWFGVNRSLFGYPPLVHAAAQGYAGACGVLLHRGANVRASTKKGLVRATEVASDKCHDWPEVRRVIEPYVKAAKAAEDAAEKARKKELENERRAAASRGKQISGGPIADLSMD